MVYKDSFKPYYVSQSIVIFFQKFLLNLSGNNNTDDVQKINITSHIQSIIGISIIGKGLFNDHYFERALFSNINQILNSALST